MTVRESDVLTTLQAYLAARADYARATEVEPFDPLHGPIPRYRDSDPYVRPRASMWLDKCRKDFLVALAGECQNRDGQLGDGVSLDVDLPDVVRLAGHVRKHEQKASRD